jgi:hypothetical protein
MTVNRLRELTSIGVDKIGAIADRLQNDQLLRLENLDTDLLPPEGVVDVFSNEPVERLSGLRERIEAATSVG